MAKKATGGSRKKAAKKKLSVTAQTKKKVSATAKRTEKKMNKKVLKKG